MNKDIFFKWLPVAAAVTIIFGTIHVSIQQIYRQSANDPQIQLAEDSAMLLAKGLPVSSLIGPSPTVDFGTSLAPFAMVFDGSGKLAASSGSLNGTIAVPPAGVLDYTRAHGEDRLTWQPPGKTRVAAVIRYFTNASTTGFILVGRNMREVENRVAENMLKVGIAWLVTMVVTFGLVAWNEKRNRQTVA